MNKEKYLNIINIVIHYLFGATFIFSSVTKVLGKRFTLNGTDYPIDTFFHFFEVLYNAQPYWQFIGVFQLFAGIFIITGFFKRIGYIIGFAIFLNISFITISYLGFGFTRYIAIGITLTLMFYILTDKQLIKTLFSQEINEIRKDILFNKSDILIGVTIGVLSFLFGITKNRPDLLLYIITGVILFYIVLKLKK